MEQQDLLNALKGKRLHWRDEDNENDGVIQHITTSKGEYILLFDDFVQVAMDKLHIEELAATGHTYDGKYSYNLDKPPIEYVRSALLGKRIAYGDKDITFKGVIKRIEVGKGSDGVMVFFLNSDVARYLQYTAVNELIATGECVDVLGDPFTLLEDEPNTTLSTTTASDTTTTSGDIVYSDGIDWEGRTWDVFRHLYLVDEIDAETALENARGMVDIYRKAMEGKV